MYRIYGELKIDSTSSENIVSEIKQKEIDLGLNKVPDKLIIRKLGIKVSGACVVEINGREFSINEKEPLEFAYDSIKVHSIIFKTSGVTAVVRYMYYREDKAFQ